MGQPRGYLRWRGGDKTVSGDAQPRQIRLDHKCEASMWQDQLYLRCGTRKCPEDALITGFLTF